MTNTEDLGVTQLDQSYVIGIFIDQPDCKIIKSILQLHVYIKQLFPFSIHCLNELCKITNHSLQSVQF